MLGTRKDDGPVRIQVHRSNSETVVIVPGTKEPLGAEQQDLVDMVMDVVPSLHIEIKGSTHTIRVVPGMYPDGLAMVGVQAWGLAGRPVEEVLQVSHDVEEMLVWSEGVPWSRASFGSQDWQRIHRELARIG